MLQPIGCGAGHLHNVSIELITDSSTTIMVIYYGPYWKHLHITFCITITFQITSNGNSI